VISPLATSRGVNGEANTASYVCEYFIFTKKLNVVSRSDPFIAAIASRPGATNVRYETICPPTSMSPTSLPTPTPIDNRNSNGRQYTGDRKLHGPGIEWRQRDHCIHGDLHSRRFHRHGSRADSKPDNHNGPCERDSLYLHGNSDQRERIDRELLELFGETVLPKRGRPRKDRSQELQPDSLPADHAAPE